MGELPIDADDSILIIGIGNEYRSDDGLGVYVARELRRHLPDNIRIVEQNGEGTALMAAWKGSAHVFIVDAVSSHESAGTAACRNTALRCAGTIHRLDAIHEKIPEQMFASSSHQFGVAEAVAMARELNELPESLTLYGIEAESFEPGVGLSESVVRSVSDLLHLVEHDVERLVERPAVR